MSRLHLLSGLVLAGSTAGIAVALADRPAGGAPPAPPTPPPVEREAGPTLKRFASARAFETYLKSLERAERRRGLSDVPLPPPPAAVAPAPAAAEASQGGGAANPEITNNQTVGVDEGGIVKQIGNYLVVLQDGRVFSIELGEPDGAPPRLADRIDVYRSPETAASWYDEMLVLGDRILVTAYNYRERASEISVLRLGRDGRMRREGRFLLSSNDYYSTENYATRLVGDKLVFYAPFALGGYGGPFEWPRLRRAEGDGEADKGKALFGPTEVYAPPGKVDDPTLHTISVCPLKSTLDCRTTAFIGPAMRDIYVSPADAFLWIGAPDGLPWSIDYRNRRRQQCPADQYWTDGRASSAAMVYRLPLDGGPIGAVSTEGIPQDQFAFDSRDGRFRALLARQGTGCMRRGQGAPLALLDIPLSSFGPTVRRLSAQAYTPLPSIEGGQLENRFLGGWLLYGGRSSWSGLAAGDAGPQGSTLFAVPLARPSAVSRLTLPHNAVRIERAGNDAVVTGYRDESGLSVSYVALGRAARVASSTRLPGRVESEGRSHAFNAWVRPDGSGIMGLPTTRDRARGGRGWSDSQSSELSFLAFGPDKQLAPAGELGLEGRRPAGTYRCDVSCIDWYGNSRPVFTGGRIFALMGTELVEGRLDGGRIRARARLDLTGPTNSRARAAMR